MAKSIVITDKLVATKVGNLESVKYYVSTTETAIENGHVVELAGLVSGSREVQKGVAVTDVKKEVVLVAAPELIYDETTRAKGLDDFENEAGKPFRAYHLSAGDIFTISDIAVTALADGTPVVGNYVITEVGATKLKESATAPAVEANRFLGKVIEKKVFGSRGIAVTTIQVIRA
jgi:hypothetical protein